VNQHELKQVIVTVGEFRWIGILYALTWALKSTQFAYAPGPKTLRWILFGFALVTAVALDQFINGWDRLRPHAHELHDVGYGFHRAQGFFDICMTFAYAVGLCTLYHLGCFLGLLNTEKREAWIELAIVSLGTACLFFSFTRGAWLAWAFAVAAGLLVWRPQFKFLLKASIVGAIAFYAFMSTPIVRNRVQSMTDVSQDQSNAQRLKIWRANIQIAKEHPIFGVGWNSNKNFILDAYQKIGLPEATFVSHSHNNTLQTLAGIGALGLGLQSWLFLTMLWISFRVARTAKDPRIQACALGALIAQIFFHVGGLTECNFIDGEVNHNLMFAWAAVLSVWNPTQTS
jgi:O-antigen ligase